jgi:hypothetical protein
MDHQLLVEEAISDIEAVFADTTVPASKTREDLEYIKDQIEIKLDSLPDELEDR